MSKEAMLYKKLDNNNVQCLLCNHNCYIKEDKVGFCSVRKNQSGKLIALTYEKVAALNIDPIEKKPLYHFFPGTKSFSLASLGCNFKCGFCQNWNISQIDIFDENICKSISVDNIVEMIKVSGCKSVAFTYTEPTVFYEYAYDIAKRISNEIKCLFVTNGYMSKQLLEDIKDYVSAANVDLKSFSEWFYKKNCQGTLAPVLENIKFMKELGMWVEVTTLIIPGENDSNTELEDIAGFIADIDKNIPWHISRFYPMYKFNETNETSADILAKAKKIGTKANLKYVYMGNIVCDNNTYCPICGEVVIKRNGFNTTEYNLEQGKCINCKTPIAGVFS